MIETSFRTRGVVFAFVIGPPRVVTRQQGMEIHDRVCDSLGVDDMTFKYAPKPPAEGPGPTVAPGWGIEIGRTIGNGVLKLSLDSDLKLNAVRFLVEYIAPPTLAHVSQDLDTIAEATFSALGAGWAKVLAEARVRGQVESIGGEAVSYLMDRVLRFNRDAVEALEEKPSFVTVGFETPAGDPSETDPLRQPKREVKVEVLREDSRSLYVELMSQWPQLVVSSPSGLLELDARRIRSFDSPPSAYLENCMTYLGDKVFPLFTGPTP